MCRSGISTRARGVRLGYGVHEHGWKVSESTREEGARKRMLLNGFVGRSQVGMESPAKDKGQGEVINRLLNPDSPHRGGPRLYKRLTAHPATSRHVHLECWWCCR